GLIVGGSAIDVVTRRVVLAHPVLDFTDALPARAPLAAIRAAAVELQRDGDRQLQIRITGNPALTHEETLSLAWDIGVSGGFCLILISAILLIALRSGPLVAGVVTTLLTGLVWTAGFAAIAVGNLNVISVAAGVLFLGLGVDFGLHLGMRYADLLRGGDSHATAIEEAARSVGGSLVICTLTTAIGFFAFLPTDYRGVAELGLITGVGLIIILFLTLTLFPALMTVVFHANPERLSTAQLRFGKGPSRFVANNAAAIRVTALVIGLLALLVVPRLRFDANIVAMRDPGTESVQTFNDLLEDAGTASPWYANSVVENLEQADALKLRMRELDVVDRSITLSDYIPDQQADKLEILRDLSLMMGPRGSDAAGPPPRPVEQQIEALRRLHELLVDALKTFEASEGARTSVLAESVLNLIGKLGDFLRQIDSDEAPEQALAHLDEILLSTLPEQLERLHRGLDASPITLEVLPERLVRRLQAPDGDGRARVQTFPSENLEDHEAFTRFVSSVQSVDPNVTGIAVNLVEFARTTQEAFRQAIATAVLVIAAILWLLWRRPRYMLLVLAPLTLAGVVTGAIMVLIDLPLNFFNVVVVPLLLGAGVDSGIHLVEQSRKRKPEEVEVLGTTTARAVLFSALTTITSFGTLGFSSHVGLSGLGTLLTVGMSLTVICNLIVLPALLAKFWRSPTNNPTH
ncbi:MAG: MMPL family transporter, partial [Deltaproteobacteria bacterium]|nr:MMPL family transporter [Deltaproteobacteria bacterium]